MSSTRKATSVCTRSWTSVSKNMLLDRGVESEMQHGASLRSVRSCQTATTSTIAGNTWSSQMDRHEALEAKAAERGVAVPDLGPYDTWRDCD